MKRYTSLLLIVLSFLANKVEAQSKVVTNETITANDGVTKTYIIVDGLTIKPPNTSTTITYTATSANSYIFRMANPDTQFIAPSNDQNFVRTESILVSGITDENTVRTLPISQKNTAYEYSDGLGRKLQSVSVQSSPSFADVVAPYKYDNYGRMPNEYLPFTSANSKGAFQPSQENGTTTFYTNPPAGVSADARPFQENIYEPSPLNRVTDVVGPGFEWKNGATTKGVKTLTKINLESENIIRWKYLTGTMPEKNGVYPSNYLTVQETTDEEGQITKVYTDTRGLVVVNRVGDGITWFDTYYLYYPSGLQAMVIQPEGISRLATEFDAIGADKNSFLNRWCFQYRYDDEQRMIANRVPGWKDGYWAYTVYDKWNRVVLTQTPAQRDNSNQWTFTKYDRFNRGIMTGLITYTATGNSDTDRATLQTSVNTLYSASTSNAFETELNNSTGYTQSATFPQNVSESSLISVSYYDNYAFQDYTGWDAEGSASLYDYVNIAGFPQKNADVTISEIMTGVKGYATGSKTRVIGTTRWLNNITYYDKKYRPVQVIAENYIGGRDRVTTLVDFTGRALKAQLYHTSSASTLTTVREFEYDHASRLVNLFQTTDGGARTLMASNKYNEIGQLIEKNIHSVDNGISFLQSIDYRYNIRGWLTSINNSALSNDGITNNDATDLFGMELLYNPSVPPTVNGYATPRLYNGNITAIKWKADTKQGAPEERIYGFDYDVLSRLEKAHYASNNLGAWTGNAGMFDEQISSYDKNGNIKGILRTGKIDGAKTTIDNLTHTYLLTGKESNRLIGVSDGSTNTTGFTDGATATEEFQYDASGNLISDLNKQISSIAYNHLNLPTAIVFTRPNGTQDQIEYTYDASGAKLRTVVKINGTQVAKTDYVGDIQYDNDQLTFASTPEGRVVRNGSSYDYEYFHKDHQDNVRLTYGPLKETVAYRATMENPATSNLGTTEESTFQNVSTTRHTNPTFNYTKSSEQVLTPDKSAQTNGYLNKIIGPAKSLRLLSGDKVRMEIMAKYDQPSGNSTPVAVNMLISALATTTFGFTPGETGFTSFSRNAGVIPGVGEGSSTLPKAYLAYLFFNDSYQFVAAGSGAISISTSAYSAFEKLERIFTANQNGYLYIYVANESDRNVYFDEMSVVHQKNSTALQVTQASDYYPFGLTFNNYQAERIGEDHKTIHKNRYGYQGQELQKDLDLNYGQFKWRMYDMVLGRFNGVDALADEYMSQSPFNMALNNPVKNIDVDGLWSTSSIYGQAAAMQIGQINRQQQHSLNQYYNQQAFGSVAFQSYKSDYINVVTNAQRQKEAAGWIDRGKESHGSYSNTSMEYMKIAAQTAQYLPMVGSIAKMYGSMLQGDMKGVAANGAMAMVEGALSVGAAEVLVGKIFNAAKGVTQGTNVVYQGFNKAGVVEYVGITSRDAAVRFGEHLSSGTAKSLLQYRVVDGATGLTRTQARVWEQTLINQYGLNNLFNVRNSIAPKYWFQYGIKP
jgi:RHS repeat-associated protein